MTKRLTLIGAVLVLALAGYGFAQLPAVAAGGLLHPQRRPVKTARPSSCSDTTFEGIDVTLRGWRCRSAGPLKGVIVYLHGVPTEVGPYDCQNQFLDVSASRCPVFCVPCSVFCLLTPSYS